MLTHSTLHAHPSFPLSMSNARPFQPAYATHTPYDRKAALASLHAYQLFMYVLIGIAVVCLLVGSVAYDSCTCSCSHLMLRHLTDESISTQLVMSPYCMDASIDVHASCVSHAHLLSFMSLGFGSGSYLALVMLICIGECAMHAHTCHVHVGVMYVHARMHASL